jgi:hypothetical protein
VAAHSGACHRDPAKRHGPYFELTYKAKGTTVNVKLTSQSAAIYKAAAQQHRRVKRILNRLESLSRQALKQRAHGAESDAGNQLKSRGYFHSPFFSGLQDRLDPG